MLVRNGPVAASSGSGSLLGGSWQLVLVILMIGLFVYFAKRARRVRIDRRSAAGPRADGGAATDIAWGDGRQSPAVLVAAADAAFRRGDYGRALELVQRARDRNDDFAHTLPAMTGRKPLREAIYHPALYAVLTDVLDGCAQSGSLSAQQVADIAFEEVHWMDRDYPGLYRSGNETYWHLFLSDYLYLYALALACEVQPGQADASHVSGSIAGIIAEQAAALQPGSLTKRGVWGKARLFAMVGRAAPAAPADWLARPALADKMPCGSLITQDEIADWLEHDRDEPSESDLSESDLPRYEPSRRRAPRPAGASLALLRDLSVQQVGRALSKPDAWWDAVDLGLYRWEMVRHFDEETTSWVRQLAYDLYALKERGDAPDTPLWDWQNLTDLFQYCLARVEALTSAVDPRRPDDRSAAQGARNYFAWSAYECMRAGGQSAAWNAFEPQLYAILNESHPQELTAVQASMLPALRQKYGSRDVHA
jgi:hypothetical protein